jgi:hypothetical protein
MSKPSSGQEDALPSKFAALLSRQQKIEEFEREKKIRREKGHLEPSSFTKNHANKANSKIPSLAGMQRHYGESMASFQARVHAVCHPFIHASMESAKPMRLKRKAYLEARKAKRQQKTLEEGLEKEMDKKNDMKFKDIVPFGEVVQAPPKLTIVPKARLKMSSQEQGVKAAAEKEALRLHMIALYRKNKVKLNE